MPANSKFTALSDAELLQLIHEDPDQFSIVARKSRAYCLGFMKNMLSPGGVREEELEDIFHDALIVLYEKILGGDFVLTSSFQTYLNSVCRNLLLKRFGRSTRTVILEEAAVEGNQGRYDPEITDVLRELEIAEDSMYSALESALGTMKEAGGKCFEMLSLFWYHKRSMAQISEHFGYTSEVNARNQKSKCQKRLRKMAHKALNSPGC